MAFTHRLYAKPPHDAAPHLRRSDGRTGAALAAWRNRNRDTDLSGDLEFVDVPEDVMARAMAVVADRKPGSGWQVQRKGRTRGR